MIEMKKLMCDALCCGDEVSIILKNGTALSGVVTSLGDDLLCLHLPTGENQPLAYDIVGTYQVIAYAQLDPALEESAIGIADLQQALKQHDPHLYRQLQSKLDSLNNALRISETEARFGRTPMVLKALLALSEDMPGNPRLMALIGEVALLTKDKDLCLEALDCFYEDWTVDCYSSANLLRLLAKLSAQANNYACISELLATCPEQMRPEIFRAVVYLMNLQKFTLKKPLRQNLSDAQKFNYVKKLLEQLRFGKLAAEPAQQKPPQPAAVKVDLKPFQQVGEVTYFTGKFGLLRDENNTTYQFVTRKLDPDVRGRLSVGANVLFYKTKVYSTKKRCDVNAADGIELLPPNAQLAKAATPFSRPELQGAEHRRIGYIILYMQFRSCGYILEESDYGTKEKGDIYFDLKNVNSNILLDTRRYHYKVSFSYFESDGDNNPARQARNIEILEVIPVEESASPAANYAKQRSADIDKMEFLPGETLILRDNTGNCRLGNFISRDNDCLQMNIQDEDVTVPYADIAELMFFGLITSYNLLTHSGKINGIYTFRSSNVINNELAHLLRLSKYSTILCAYSLLAEDNHFYVNNVDYITDALLKQLAWKSGRIEGLYQKNHYFSVNQAARCYISTIKDRTLLRHFNSESQDFLQQEVFYKEICHKAFDGQPEGAQLVNTVLDIRCRYQLGKISSHANNPSVKHIHGGPFAYQSEQDLSVYDHGASVTMRLRLTSSGALVVDQIDGDTQLPVFQNKDGQNKEDVSRESQPFDVYDFDSELQLGNFSATTLLEFTRDAFDLEHIRAYLPKAARKQILDGEFVGLPQEGKMLVQMLRNCDADRRRQTDKDHWAEKVPAQDKPALLLAAAKLHSQLCRITPEDDFFCEQVGNEILFAYAWRYLTAGRVTEPAEIEYYSESVFLNDFRDSVKNQMKARCLAEYFRGIEATKLASYGDHNGILAILRRDCTDVMGLTKMLLNLPRSIFEDLLESAKSLKNQSLLIAVANCVSGSSDMHTDTQRLSADIFAETIQTYYQQYNAIKSQFALRVSKEISINALPSLLPQIEEAEQGVGRFLFDADRSKLERIRKIVNGIADTLMNEDVVTHTTQMENAFGLLQSLVVDIENHPSKFSFEVLRTFAMELQSKLVEYLNRQYEQYQPQLKIEHYCISSDMRRETLCVSNASNCLTANNVRISTVAPYGGDAGFIVDLESNRQIYGEGKSIAGGKGIELSIPIDVTDSDARGPLALTVSLSYERNVAFNPGFSIADTKMAYTHEVNIQISLTTDEDAYLTSEDNRYRAFAGGKEMKPDKTGEAEQMFFGREEDIEKIYKMIVDSRGNLASGSIVAIYGQKRCGKTSVMNFLGKRIQESFPDALVLTVNAQNVSREDMYKGLLSEICTEFRKRWRRNPQLKKDLEESGLEIPSAGSIFSPGGEAGFNAFFREFRADFEDRYPIVLMVDEFTQAYILMKTGELSGDFLNRWRAMIQSNEFVNIIVGQDFMEKFTTDEDITRLNYGGSVNGLGTMGRKRLSYLDYESAEKMMKDPIRKPDGVSRYEGILGKEAVKRIYDLTGGSAFYLMKFCNALVNYMIETREQLVYTSLVETVAEAYVFDTRDNPITKTDFDPIYNAYSYDSLSDTDELEDMDAHAQREMDKSYAMLKTIADNSNRLGLCNTSSIVWDDSEEKAKILQTLRIRGVLCDANGAEIKSENMENINVKIKVGLFSIWLKKRG